MAEDEYARAKIEEHSKRMDVQDGRMDRQDSRVDRQETLTDRIFSALDSMNRWRAKNTVYMAIGSALFAWAAFYLLQHYMDEITAMAGGAAHE